MQKKYEKKGADSDYDSFSSDKEVKELKQICEFLKKKYMLSNEDILSIAKKDVVPLSAFSSGLSPLEALVGFLKDILRYKNKKIAEALGRSEKTVSHAYLAGIKKAGKIKLPGKERVSYSVQNHLLPVTIFSNRKLSVLENCVVYCKDSLNLRFNEISRIIQRDSRTVWTSYSRAKGK